MSDWDVLAPAQASSGDEGYEEEEWFDDDYEYYDEQEYDDDDYMPYPPRVTASSFQMPAMKVSGSPIVRVKRVLHNRRDDRLAYRHRTGAGIRKGHLTTGNDINESLKLYNEGYGSYNDRAFELREKDARELLPDYDKNKPEVPSGAGSKIINITRVKKGALSKIEGRSVPKDDVLNVKVDTDPKHYWDHISHQLMEDGQFVQAKYDSFHDQAINERATLGIGNSAEMNSLYCFWCFYLREHFDQSMYDEFLRLSREDVAGGSHYGIECYFRFCSYGLEIRWDEKIFHEFENEAMEDHRRKCNYGLEKLQAFRVNQKHDFPIPFNPDIIAILNKYPTMKSFREPMKPEGKKPKRAEGKKALSILSAKKEQPDPRREQPDPKSAPKEKPFDPKNPGPRKEQPDPRNPGPKKEQPDPRKENTDQKKERKRRGPPHQEKKQTGPVFGVKTQPVPPELRKANEKKGGKKKEEDEEEITNPNRPQRHQPNRGFELGARIQPSSAPMDSMMRKRW